MPADEDAPLPEVEYVIEPLDIEVQIHRFRKSLRNSRAGLGRLLVLTGALVILQLWAPVRWVTRAWCWGIAAVLDLAVAAPLIRQARLRRRFGHQDLIDALLGRCGASLSAEGFLLWKPVAQPGAIPPAERWESACVPWTRVKQIETGDSALYFHFGGGGFPVPLRAFQSLEAMHGFEARARALKSAATADSGARQSK